MIQSVKHPSLDFSSGHDFSSGPGLGSGLDLRVVGMSPASGSALGMESA